MMRLDITKIPECIAINKGGYIVPISDKLRDHIFVPYNKLKYSTNAYPTVIAVLSIILCAINLIAGRSIIPTTIPMYMTILAIIFSIYIHIATKRFFSDEECIGSLISLAIMTYDLSVGKYYMASGDADVIDYRSKEDFERNDKMGAYLYIFSQYTCIITNLAAETFNIFILGNIIDVVCAERVFKCIIEKYGDLQKSEIIAGGKPES